MIAERAKKYTKRINPDIGCQNFSDMISVRSFILKMYMMSEVAEVVMYERMLNKQAEPTVEEMTEFCGKNAERFSLLNEWLTSTFNTEQKAVFPYEVQFAGSEKTKFREAVYYG